MMNRTYRLKSTLFVLVTLTFILPCYGQEIVITGNDNKPPKVYMQQGEAKGILVDIMKYVDERIPQTFRFELRPWKRAYKNAKKGGVGIIGLSKNSERLKIFDYSDPLFIDEVLLVVLKGNEFHYENIQDLKGKVVGARRGASYGDDFERGKQSVFRLSVDNTEGQRLLKLLSGRIDVALISPGKAGFNKTIEQEENLLTRKGEFVILSTPFKRDPNHLGFAKTMKMDRFLQQVNEVLRKGIQSGEILKIIDRHLVQNVSMDR